MDAKTTAYETGFANGYGTLPVPEVDFDTLAELQSWEDGLNDGKVARDADDLHRAQRA